MAKVELAIEVVGITRKDEHLGYKVYINDFVHTTKLPRKPGDIKRRGKIITSVEYNEPVDYYTGALIESIQQALIDWQIWKKQGYKRSES